MKGARRFDRTSPTTVVSTVVVLAAMVIALLALLIFAPTSSAGPAEDCAAVRARDHQIYLNLIASLPPGAPIPPEYINPCLTAPSTTATAAPTTTVGLPGAQAPGGGPNVGANAPTNFPTYNGTPIVPVPTIEVPPIASESPTSETGAGAFPDAPTSAVPSPTSTLDPTPGEGTTPDRGPGPIPASTSNSVPEQQESTQSVTTSGLDEGDGRDRYLELVLVGAAAFTAGGIGVRGRRSPFGPRTSSGGRTPLGGRPPESVLSQVVGTLASPLMTYAKGGFEQITIPNGDGGERTLVLINDPTSPHTYRFPQQVPPGGRMIENPDGSVSILDADGNTVSVIDAPWAYDAAGRPVRTEYDVDGDTIVQTVYPAADSIYPIVGDPNRTYEADGSVTDTYEDGWINVKDNGDGTSTVSTPDGQPYLIATQGGQASDVGLDMSSDDAGSEPTSGLDQAQGVAPGSADDDATTGDYGNSDGGYTDYGNGGGGTNDYGNDNGGGGEDGQWSDLDQAQGTAPGSATGGPVSTTESDGSRTLTYPDGSWINTRVNPDGSQTVSYPDAPPEVIFPDGQRASTTYNGTTATTSLYGADNSLDEQLTTYQVGTPDESWVHTVYDEDGGHTVYYPDSAPDHFGADGTRTEIINGDVVTFNTDGTVADIESVESKATRDWLGEITSTLVAVSTFSQNIRGANGIAGLADAGGDILDAGKTVAGAAVAYSQDPSGTTAQTLAGLARLDALEQYGPQYWIRQLQHDAALAVLTGPFGEAAAATRVATTAERIEAGIARTAADDVGEGLGRVGADPAATAPVKLPTTSALDPGTTLPHQIVEQLRPGLSPGEVQALAHAQSVYESPVFSDIRQAHDLQQPVELAVNGYALLYEPNIPGAGWSLATDTPPGFIIGPEAFTSEAELARTVLHESYRLFHSRALDLGMNAERAASETNAAQGFADRLFELLLGD